MNRTTTIADVAMNQHHLRDSQLKIDFKGRIVDAIQFRELNSRLATHPEMKLFGSRH